MSITVGIDTSRVYNRKQPPGGKCSDLFGPAAPIVEGAGEVIRQASLASRQAPQDSQPEVKPVTAAEPSLEPETQVELGSLSLSPAPSPAKPAAVEAKPAADPGPTECKQKDGEAKSPPDEATEAAKRSRENSDKMRSSSISSFDQPFSVVERETARPNPMAATGEPPRPKFYHNASSITW